jgi:hypothetical protein
MVPSVENLCAKLHSHRTSRHYERLLHTRIPIVETRTVEYGWPAIAKESHCWNRKAFCIKPEKPVLSSVGGELAVASVANTVGKRVEERAASLIWSA